ncbi:MAG: hypothetical protein WDW38_000175 [Sanguina aurantia]
MQLRQPVTPSRKVPSGTPSTSAMVSPLKTSATARPALSFPAAAAAALEATARKTPCEMPAAKRAPTSVARLGANTMTMCARVKKPSAQSRVSRRVHEAISPVRMAPPTQTPNA